MDEYDRLMKVHDDAENVLTAIMDNAISFSVTMLPGPVLAKAREMVMIADSIRSYKTNS